MLCPALAALCSLFGSQVAHAICTVMIAIPFASMDMALAVFISTMGPIAPVMVSHLMPVSDTVEYEQAISRIEIVIIPAAAKTNIGKTISIIAAIISVIRVKGITGDCVGKNSTPLITPWLHV